MKFKIHFFLFLIWIAITAAKGQTPVGTININGTEVELFYKIKGTTAPTITTPPVVIEQPIVNNSGARISSSRYDLAKGFVLTFKINDQSPQQVSWDGETYYPLSVVYQSPNRTQTYWLKSGTVATKIEVKTATETSQPIIVGEKVGVQNLEPLQPVITAPIVTPTSVGVQNLEPFQPQYATLNQTYTSSTRARIHFPTCNNDREAQILVCKKEGQIIYSYNRPQWWNPESAYYGNHPLETQFAVTDGNYDFYIKNTGTKPIIAGITSGDGYIFYFIKGTLQSVDKWKKLQPNEEWTFTIYINDKAHNSSYLNDSKIFSFSGPFYENGDVTTDEIKIKDFPNGYWIPSNGTATLTYEKKSNPAKNITIKFTTHGTAQDAQFEVMAKNGLDISPSYSMLTCYNTTVWKIFNNNSSGYADSDDYIPK